MPDHAPVIVWFSRDLRLHDHPALSAAAETGAPVIPVYVLAGEAASHPLGAASRWWLHHSLSRLEDGLRSLGSRLVLLQGSLAESLKTLAEETGAAAIYHSFPIEPDEVEAVESLKALEADGVTLKQYAANLLYEPGSVLTQSDEPYKVFTPFYKACLSSQ
ncbi:MAG: deoxyribodipyrimidine photo-lyase, partial [Alphaproteobacteria bacterium]|nr:deoxyribodipyrimidine photo-lyase [Alphaproteobacteria bacterium]